VTKKSVYSNRNPRQDKDLEYYQGQENMLTVFPYYEMKQAFRERLLDRIEKQAVEINYYRIMVMIILTGNQLII
jgi:hypothetical protein